jgi:exosome complex RNA-binding protein Csl4
MEEKNKGLNINIEHYTGEKPIEVVYRLGDAAQAQQPLATKAPEKISVSGTISTPYEWLSKRIDTVDQKRANVVVNREKMTIQLTVNEDDYYNKNTFTGTVEVSETFEKFG